MVRIRRNAPLRQTERPSFPDELRHVLMHDAAAILDGIVAGDDEFGPVVLDPLERTVLALLGRTVVHDGHRHLHVGVLHLGRAHDEIALQLADTPHTHLVAQAPRVVVDDVLKHGTVVDAVVRVEREVEAQVSEVVLLLATERLARFHVEALAASHDLCVLENLEVSPQRLALDMDSLLCKVVENVSQACRCPEIVCDVLSDRLEHGHVADLDPASDVLLQDFLNNRFDIGPLVGEGIVGKSLGKAPFQDISIELCRRIRVDRLAEKRLHVLIFLEGKRLHLELDIATGELGHEFARKQVAVGSGDENRPIPIGSKGVHDFLVALHVLHLIDEKIFQAIGCIGGGVIDCRLEFIGGLNLPQLSAIQIEVDDGSWVDAAFSEFLGNSPHKAGLSASPYACNDLDNPIIMVKTPNLLEVVFAPEKLHFSPLISDYASILS